MGDDPKSESQQQFDDRLVIRPWSDLDKEPDREVLIEGILFGAGVSTVVSAPGGGKTTFAVALAMTVASGGMWAGKPVKPRPVLWIVADDKGTLKSIRQIWLKENPNAKLVEGGGWIDGPVDLSDAPKSVKELRDWLKGKPPMLIVIDMLADCFGELDDERGKDAIKVYKQIWLIVRETGSTFLNLQHAPWNGKRPKGSIAIPGKNDIILIIDELNVDEGYITMEHFKRREGPLTEMKFEVKLVELEGKPHPLPLVTGRTGLDLTLNEDLDAAEGHARDIVRIMVVQSKSPVAWKDLLELSGKSKTTFKRGLNEAVKGKGWLMWSKGGYSLNPDNSWKEALTEPGAGSEQGPKGPPHRGVDPATDPQAGTIGPSLDPVGPWTQTGLGTDSEKGVEALRHAAELFRKADEARGGRPIKMTPPTTKKPSA
jgi:hypothetical protein